MSSRAGRAARAEARARAAKQQSQRQSDPPPEPDYNTPSSFYGASEGLSNSISGWLNSNKGNKAVGAAGADLYYNSATAALKQESDVSYAKAMAPEALKYQEGAQRIASDAEDRRIASQGKVDFDQQKLVTDATRYTADQSLAGTKYQSDSEEKQIGLTGDESRKNLKQQTEETVRLRADARGAIRDRGRTLFA